MRKWLFGDKHGYFPLPSARYCFIENLYAQGKMADCEYAVISEWFNYLITCPNLVATFFVCVTDPISAISPPFIYSLSLA